MGFYIDSCSNINLDNLITVNNCCGVDLEIRPGTLELIKALDLVLEYCLRIDSGKLSEEREIVACHEKILSAFEQAMACDPHNLATIVSRIWICSNILGYPHIALQDLNVLYRLRGTDKDIWIIANKEIANAMSQEVFPVNGTEYFAFKTNISEKDLYYIRSEMCGYLGKHSEQIRDLKKAAWLGHEKAIEELYRS